MGTHFLSLKRLKCFESLTLRIENLTVLTGPNGAGKSTITQAIRLLRDAATANAAPSYIHLNSSGFQLGTYDEIFNRTAARTEDGIDVIEIGFSDTVEGKAELARFSPAEISDECEYVEIEPVASPSLANKSSWYFTYLSAERYGPRLRQDQTDGHRANKIGVGIKGEFCAEVLSNAPTTRIDERLIFQSLLSSTGSHNALLNSNLEKWMSHIVGPIEIRALRPPRLSMPMLEFRKNGPEAEWQFPTNHGFGVSYTLPIVLAGLLTEEDGYLIVDSPEAHLHPAAQTALAGFLAFVAASGRHVIVETHSDHIIDGFRLAIADNNNPLGADRCVFHYLSRGEDGDIVHHDLSPRENGSLPKWPRGFFDQTAANLRKLSGFGKVKNDN